MATVALGVIGNAILPGIGGAIGVGLGSAVDSLVAGAITRRLLKQDAPVPETREFPGVDAGVPAPWVHGSAVRVGGTVIYMSDIRPQEILGEQKGKSPNVVAGYNYFVDVAIAWCRNVCAVDPVRKIWASGELIYGNNPQFSFDLTTYSVENQDRWGILTSNPEVEDGEPWCDDDDEPDKRKVQRDHEMLWLAIPGSDDDQLYASLIGQIGFTTVTIANCLNAANNGAFFCTGMLKENYQYPLPPGGELHNVYRVIFRRCNILYPDPNEPCEPDPTPCGPAVTEVVPENDGPNTAEITVFIPGFSRYFDDIRNYTGAESGPTTADSRPNEVADTAITTNPNIDPLNVPAFRGTCYTVLENLDITKWAGTLPQFEAQIRERSTATPQTAVEALLARSESENSVAVDTEPLFDGTTIILGFQEIGPSPPNNRIKELADLYNFEPQEVQVIPDGGPLPQPQLLFTFQDDLPRVQLTSNETSAREFGSPGRVHAAIRRGTKENLPQELTFDYSSIDKDFQPDTISYSYSSAPVQNRQKVSTNIVMSPASADLIARQLLWKVNNFADQIDFSALPHEMALVEGDRFEIAQDDGTTLFGRTKSTTRGENGLIEVRGEIDDQLAYDQEEGGGYAAPVSQDIQFASAGEARVMDTSPLTAADASVFGVYVALRTVRTDLATSYGVYASTDQVNWVEMARFSAAAVTGDTTTVLGGPVDDSNWDEINTVDVLLYSAGHALENRTREEVASGLNWAFLGGEIIGFTTATLVASGSNPYAQAYRLSGLLRGRRDTWHTMGSHEIGDPFCLLPASGAGVGFVPLQLERYQQNVYVRVAPQGVAVTDPDVAETEIVFRPNAETLRPFSVHGVWGIRRPDQSTCVFATPRTRIPFRIFSGLIPPTVETGPASDYKAIISTITPFTSTFVQRRVVEGCAVSTRSDQISFAYTRQMVIEDLVNTGILESADDLGFTRFEIYRESDSIGPGRRVEFCVASIGPEFVGSCAIPS